MARVGAIGGMNTTPARVGVPPVRGIVASGDYRLFGVPKTIAEATTLTRASTGTYIDVDGVMQTAAIDALRFDYSTGAKMMLIEAAATNRIRNNTMAGAVAGTPGTLPTNWSAVLSGLSQEIVGTGTEDGINYVDIHFSGTTSATFSSIVIDNALTSLLGSTAYTYSVYIKRVAGAATNISSTSLYFRYNLNPSGTTDISAAISVPSTGALKDCRKSKTGTTSASILGGGSAFILMNHANGVAIDSTLRIGLPQLEAGSTYSSAIPTTSAAVTRSADVLALIGTGTNNWLLTFDNDAVQAFAGEVDDLAITASALTRPCIKSWVARTA